MSVIMNSKIIHHPSVQNAQDMQDICSPLNLLDISYFCHVRIDKQNNFAALSNNPGFHTHYLNNRYYNADIHLANTNTLGNHILWDLLSCTGETQKMNEEAEAFGIRHTFTIVDKNSQESNYYHFSTNKTDCSVNQNYLRNQDLLKLFILQFKEKVAQSNQLKHAFAINFQLDNPCATFLSEEEWQNNLESRKLFLQGLQIKSTSALKTPLSTKEMEILYWLHNGKTLDQIAQIIGLSTIMVKKYIAAMKDKTHCYTQFQLGEYFSSILG